MKIKRFIKDFDTFVRENLNQTEPNDNTTVSLSPSFDDIQEYIKSSLKPNEIILANKKISDHERIITIRTFTDMKFNFSKRGGDDISNRNKEVMKKGEDISKLDLSKDTERLEYAFRFISTNIFKSLKLKNLVISGKTICTNIRKEPTGTPNEFNVLFDFIYENDDTINSKNEKLKGKTEKKLAGVFTINNRIIDKTVQQVEINLVSTRVENSMIPTPKDGVELANRIARFIADGLHSQFNNEWVSSAKTVWVDADKLGEAFKKYPKASLTLNLMRKYGVDPVSKQQDISVIEVNKDLNYEDPNFDKKVNKGKFAK